MSFIDKLKQIVYSNESRFIICLSPDISLIPQNIMRYDEPYLPFGKTVINATSDHVCGYIFDLSAYLTFGAVGMIALERTINYVGRNHITVLDGAFVGNEYSVVMDENSFGVDAITIGGAWDKQTTIRADRAVFFITDSLSNAKIGEANKGFKIDKSLFIQDFELKILDRDFVYHDRTDSFSDTLRQQIERLRTKNSID